MLTVQLVNAVPPFVLIVGCLLHSIWILLKPLVFAHKQYDAHKQFLESLLPVALLAIGLQGLFGSLIWPAVGLLSITAYLGTSKLDIREPSSTAIQRRGGSLIDQVVVFSCAGALILLGFCIISWVGLVWGTVCCLVIAVIVCYLVFAEFERWEYEDWEDEDMGGRSKYIWSRYSDDDSARLEKEWRKESKDMVNFEITHPRRLGLPAGSTRQVDVEKMEQVNSATGQKRNVRRIDSTLSIIRHQLGTPEMCLVYTLVLTLFWIFTKFKTWSTGSYNPPHNDLQHICERLYQPDGTESFGHVLDVDMLNLGWDIALLIVLLLHRHRLLRRGEWSDELNSDLSQLVPNQLDRSFSLLPPLEFWDDALLRPVKQNVAVYIQDKVQLTSLFGVRLSTLSMISLVMVLVAASLGMMCVFDDIPTHIDFEDWSIVWTGQTGDSCLSRNPHYLLVMVVFSLFFTFVGLLSWAVVCDITGLKADEGKVEVGLEIQPGLDASSPSDDDGYVPILCWQLVALPLVVALYFEMTGQSASQISQSVTQSSSVPTSIVALGCGVFMLIIADRVVYITESRTWKLLMQWLSLMAFCAYWITADSLAVDESDSSENWSWTGSWSIRLMVACSMYFYKSATQLERKLKRKHGRAFTQYDQVPGDKITMLHKLRFLIRRTPFLMELVYLVRDSHFCA
eukprot:COSAG02_NODE_61_length_43452_cov_741.297804_26_plen_681_part_00